MCAAEHIHTPTPEDIMAYLDGEATSLSREAMDAHIAGCVTCRTVVANLQNISSHAQAWQVGDAPGSLRTPARPRARLLTWPTMKWTSSRAAVASIGAAAALIVVISLGPGLERRRNPPTVAAHAVLRDSEGIAGSATPSMDKDAPPPPAYDSFVAGGPVQGRAGAVGGANLPRQAQTPVASASPQRPMVIRTATLAVVAKQFEGVRAAVEAIVSQSSGFIDHLSITGNTTSARSLGATLRVPGDRMAGVLEKLRQLGQVVEDTQGSEDVTDQLVDLDARLANARATEQRLADILRNRTGKLSDVLEVEQEIARVRLDIERMDAEKANMNRRVSYATITLTVSEERKVSIEAGPLSLGTRLRIAAADGIETGFETIFGALLFVLRSGPVLLLWAAVAAVAGLIARRTVSRLLGSQSTASE